MSPRNARCTCSILGGTGLSRCCVSDRRRGGRAGRSLYAFCLCRDSLCLVHGASPVSLLLDQSPKITGRNRPHLARRCHRRRALQGGWRRGQPAREVPAAITRQEKRNLGWRLVSRCAATTIASSARLTSDLFGGRLCGGIHVRVSPRGGDRARGGTQQVLPRRHRGIPVG